MPPFSACCACFHSSIPSRVPHPSGWSGVSLALPLAAGVSWMLALMSLPFLRSLVAGAVGCLSPGVGEISPGLEGGCSFPRGRAQRKSAFVARRREGEDRLGGGFASVHEDLDLVGEAEAVRCPQCKVTLGRACSTLSCVAGGHRTAHLWGEGRCFPSLRAGIYPGAPECSRRANFSTPIHLFLSHPSRTSLTRDPGCFFEL